MLKIYQKPTNHVQECPTCKQPLMKGDFLTCDTLIERGFTRNEYHHVVCFLREFNQLCVVANVHGLFVESDSTLPNIVTAYADEITKPI